MHRIQVTNNDWQTRVIPINNKTTRTLKNGKVVATWSSMLRQAAKIR
jgi:hypothetical protein